MFIGRRWLLKWARTAHVYATLFGWAIVLFFAVTGFMLNHDGWFGADAVRTSTATGVMPAEALAGPDKLAVVERLRSEFGATGAVESFETEEESLKVAFLGPGRRAEAVIDRGDGRTEIRIESTGLVGVLTDLHKGKGSGPAWGLVIDFTAALLLIASVTGLTMWTSLRNRRTLGIAALAMGTTIGLLVYLLAVP